MKCNFSCSILVLVGMVIAAPAASGVGKPDSTPVDARAPQTGAVVSVDASAPTRAGVPAQKVAAERVPSETTKPGGSSIERNVAGVMDRHPEALRKGPIPQRFVGVWTCPAGNRTDYLVVAPSMVISWLGTESLGEENVVPGSSIIVRGNVLQYTAKFIYAREAFGTREYSTQLTTKITLSSDTLRLIDVPKTVRESASVTMGVGNRDKTYLRSSLALHQESAASPALGQSGDAYRTACRGGDMAACTDLATCHLKGTCGLTKNSRQAGELYRKACDANHMTACGLLGHCYEGGDCGWPKDEVRAGSLYQQACDANDGNACVELGRCYLGGRCGLSKNPRRSQQLYQKACDASHMSGCTALGKCYEDGDCGLPSDKPRAAALYQTSCNGGNMKGCSELADSYLAGEKFGLTRDTKRAVELYAKACEGGEMFACSSLGRCYMVDECGLTRNAEESTRLFQKACDGGHLLDGCTMLGLLLAGGGVETGFATDAKRAVQLYKKACDGGEPTGLACTALAECYLKGQCGLAKNKQRARDLLQKACKIGGPSSPGCRSLPALNE